MIKAIKKILFYLYAGDYSLIYVTLLFFTIAIIGYEGIYKGIVSIQEKQKLIVQFMEIEKLLVEKDSIMVTTENTLRNNQEELSYLNLSIPEEPSMEDYLQDIAIALASDGYTIQRLSVDKVLDQTILVKIQLLGDLQNISRLYASLNALDRVTVLNSSKTMVDDSDTITNLELNVYYLK